MKAIILAGGFARRLWPLTKNKAKPLLEVGGKPIIAHLLDKIEKVDEIEEVFISTNSRFEEQFKSFIKGFSAKKKLKLVIEPASGENEKLGSIGGLNYLINKEKINDDVIIIGGDNLFEFDINELIRFYNKKKQLVVGVYDIKDKALASEFGVVSIDEDKKIINFEEKPAKPKTTLISTAVYIYPRKVLRLVKEYLEQGNCPDKAGSFLAWLHKKMEVFAFVFSERWFDIGSLEALEQAREYYIKHTR